MKTYKDKKMATKKYTFGVYDANSNIEFCEINIYSTCKSEVTALGLCENHVIERLARPSFCHRYNVSWNVFDNLVDDERINPLVDYRIELKKYEVVDKIPQIEEVCSSEFMYWLLLKLDEFADESMHESEREYILKLADIARNGLECPEELQNCWDMLCAEYRDLERFESFYKEPIRKAFIQAGVLAIAK